MNFPFEIFNVISTTIFQQDEVTIKLDSFEDETPLDVIEKAKEVYSVCLALGFEVEVYQNDDETISLLSMMDNYSAEFEIANTDELSVRYQIGKGLDFKVIWRHKKIKQKDLGKTLSQIRMECEGNTLSETLTSTTFIELGTTLSHLGKSLSSLEEASQSSVKNAQLKPESSQHFVNI